MNNRDVEIGEGPSKPANAPAHFLSKINGLAIALRSPEITSADVCQHLCLETFNGLDAAAVFISELTSAATVRTRENFGIEIHDRPRWEEIPLTLKAPVAETLRTGEIKVVNTLPDWSDQYSDLKTLTFPPELKTFISAPIPRFELPIAAIGIFSYKKIEPEPQLEAFLIAVGNLISLALFRNAKTSHHRNELVIPSTLQGLTERQIQILELISQQHTNVKIANHLGYSESTVRQETMKIFEYLGVESRINAARMYSEYKELEAKKHTLPHN